MSGRDNIYWDTCIFIAHITNEIRQDPQEMLGIDELVALFDRGQIALVTSTITISEVLSTTIKPEHYQKFRLFIDRKNFHLIEVSRKIAEISEEIRSFYYQPDKPTITTPDCIHLATAIWFKCEAFYTFDGEGVHPGLLSLNNPIADKYRLAVQKPVPTSPPQLSLNI